jgi:myo-inositol 2-dehydrogenase/D-chiro-inositol 1-dehydrogenase
MTLHTADFTDRAEPLLNFFIERYQEAFDAEISEFVDAVESGRVPSVGFEDGRLALVLAEAALKSIAEARVVAVKEIA